MKKSVVVFLIFILASFVFSINSYAFSARSFVVINADSGEVIYGENYNAKMPMASTTKIMTALILCENADLSKEVTVTDEMVAVEGTSLGLLSGDRITYRDLLYGMMLSSGNDAANTIAISLCKSIDNFVDLMNKRAEALELYNTHFNTPSGLDGNSHYTTAYELSIIAKEAIKNPEFCKAVSSYKSTISFGNPPRKVTVKNHNKLLKLYDDVCGIKTGFTKKSGRCLVSMAKKDGKSVIAVTLNDKDDWNDHRQLLNIGLNAVKVKTINDFSIKTNIVSGEKPFADLFCKKETLSLNEEDGISEKIFVSQFLYAPIKKGEKVGEAICIKNDKKILCRDIKSLKEIKQKKTNKTYLFLDIFVMILRSINEG